MITATVYFHGPLTEWQGRPADDEVVARFESRWRYFAQSRALAALRLLNSGRCGVMVTDSRGKTLEHLEATVRVVAPL
jgi:hypothetical protein